MHMLSTSEYASSAAAKTLFTDWMEQNEQVINMQQYDFSEIVFDKIRKQW